MNSAAALSVHLFADEKRFVRVLADKMFSKQLMCWDSYNVNVTLLAFAGD